MHYENHLWYSPNVGRDMGLRVIGYAGEKVLVFPTRDGNCREYENLRMHHWLSEKIESGLLQLFCVDSLASDSLYADWMRPADRILRHICYERYILEEVMPLMEYRNPLGMTTAHGLSLGAYHAVNTAFRHPHRFQKLRAFSGRYDLTLRIEEFRDLFDGYYDDTVHAHNPSRFLPLLDDPERIEALRKMDMIFTIGREDPFLEDNRHLSRVLNEKGIPHSLIEWDGRAHEGYSWRRMAPLYI